MATEVETKRDAHHELNDSLDAKHWPPMPSKPTKRAVVEALTRVFGNQFQYVEHGEDLLGYFHGRVDSAYATVTSHAYGKTLDEVRTKLIDWCESIMQARVGDIERSKRKGKVRGA